MKILYKWIKIHYGDQTDIIPGDEVVKAKIDSPLTVIERIDGYKIITTAPVTFMCKEEEEC